LSQHSWPRWRTSWWWSKSSSSMSHDKVTSMESSVWLSPISSLVLSAWFLHEIEDNSHLQYDVLTQIIGRETFDGQCQLAAVLELSALTRFASWFLCKWLFLTWLCVGSICCYEDLKLENVGDSV
jgi:hypothetical protein